MFNEFSFRFIFHITDIVGIMRFGAFFHSICHFRSQIIVTVEIMQVIALILACIPFEICLPVNTDETLNSGLIFVIIYTYTVFHYNTTT